MRFQWASALELQSLPHTGYSPLHFGREAARWCVVNRWGIPNRLEQEVIQRDQSCVYCGIEFVSTNATRKSKPTWEHIVNNDKIINRENIARCCFSCNASKGKKELSVWLESNYCKKRGITKDTVAEVIKMALIYPPQIGDSDV